MSLRFASTPRHVAGVLGLGALALLVTADLSSCTPAEPEPSPEGEDLPFAPAGPTDAPAPHEFGPYPVGVRTITFVDNSRVTEGFETPRTLVCEVWYPATEAARGESEDYVLHDYLDEEQKLIIAPEALGVLNTVALRDADPRENKQFPVVLFSHGKGGIRMQSTFYTTTLASHGYVGIAPDHEGDTLTNILNEGDFEITSTAAAFFDRPVDITFLINQLRDLEDDPLVPLLDLEHIGVTGHSFGALTSFRTAGYDYRVDAIVAQTPVGYALANAGLEVQMENFGIPVMIQAGGEDRTLPADLHADSLWDHMVAPRYYLTLDRAGHFTYSDLCVLDVESIDAALGEDVDVSNVLTDGCGVENIPPEIAFPVINHYSIALFNTYLRESPGSEAYLDDPSKFDFGGVDLSAETVTFQFDPK